MIRLRSLKLVALSAAVIAVLMVAEAAQAIAEGYLVNQENEMVGLVNQHRTGMGLQSLRTDAALQTVARRQASRMVAAGYIYHNPNLGDEAGAAVPTWMKIGENVGVGPDVPSVENAFLASPHHRENIEDGAYNVIGLGAESGSGGAMYFTQNFANAGAPTPAPAPSQSPTRAAVTTTARRATVPTTSPRTTLPPRPKAAVTTAAPKPALTTTPTKPQAAHATTTSPPPPTSTSAAPVPTTAATPVPLTVTDDSAPEREAARLAGQARVTLLTARSHKNQQEIIPTHSRVGMWRTIGSVLGRVANKFHL